MLPLRIFPRNGVTESAGRSVYGAACPSDKCCLAQASGQFGLFFLTARASFPGKLFASPSPLLRVRLRLEKAPLYGQAVLCLFRAQCARAFRSGVGARAGGSGGTDESLVTCTPGARMCPWPCPRNRTSVGQQAAGQKTGRDRCSGEAER